MYFKQRHSRLTFPLALHDTVIVSILTSPYAVSPQAGKDESRMTRSVCPIEKFHAERSDGPSRSPCPSGRAEERSARGGQGHCKMPLLRELTRSGCLSVENAVNKASSGAPPLDRAPQAARSEAQGHVQWGPPFFGYSFWRSKKSNCAAGRTSRPTALAKKPKPIKATDRNQGTVIPPLQPCAEHAAGVSGIPQGISNLAPPAPRFAHCEAPSRKTEKRTL